MDCETFETHVIDELYGELDEVTHAAMKRHMDGCERCSELFHGLQATREVGVLPLVEPDESLEERILAATAKAQPFVPWHRKVIRGIAWAGSHAMRPQLAMAAVLLLMLGSSLLLLRARPGSPGAAPVRVTERGEPVPELAAATADVTPPPAAAPTTAALGAASDAEGARGGERKARAADEAESATGSKETAKADGKAAEQQAEAGEGADADRLGKEPAVAALTAARALRSRSGCPAAVGKFDEVGARYPGTVAAAEAMWDAATCHKQNGNLERAREIYALLKDNPSFRDRAEQEIAAAEASLGNANQAPGGGKAGAAAAARAPAAAARPKAVAAPEPAPVQPPAKAGSPGKAPSSPARSDAAF